MNPLPASLAASAVFAALAAPALAVDVAAPATLSDAATKAPGILGISDTGWDTKLELGINGTSGNTESLNVHAALTTLHTDEDGRDKAALTYDHGTSEGIVTANRFVAEELHDFFNVFPKDSRWGLYGNIRYEYNDFAAWRHQLSAFAGPSYRILKDETYTLIAHAGLGGIYKDGGVTDNGHFTPEAQLGADFLWKIDARQTFEASVNAYPSLEKLGDFRGLAAAAYNLGIDATKTLRLAAEYDYISTAPPPVRKGNFRYWISLVMKL